MAVTSINKTVAKTAIKNLEKDYASIIAHLDTYVTDIQGMNTNAWSGGSRANKTYKVASDNYKNSVTIVESLKTVIESLDKYVDALDSLN